MSYLLKQLSRVMQLMRLKCEMDEQKLELDKKHSADMEQLLLVVSCLLAISFSPVLLEFVG